MILLALALALPAVAPPQRPLPREVTRFIEKRDSCEHWMGEEGYDAVRKRQIERAVRSECTGVDRELDRLRARYRRNAAVIAALKDYYKVNYR